MPEEAYTHRSHPTQQAPQPAAWKETVRTDNGTEKHYACGVNKQKHKPRRSKDRHTSDANGCDGDVNYNYRQTQRDGTGRRAEKQKHKHRSVSWFSVVFITCAGILLLFSLHRLYLHFPSSASKDNDGSSSSSSGYSGTTDSKSMVGEEKNNDDVVQAIISQEKEKASVEEWGRGQSSHRHNTLFSTVDSGGDSSYAMGGVLNYFKSYFDLQPLNNMLVRAGLRSPPQLPSAPSISILTPAEEGLGEHSLAEETSLVAQMIAESVVPKPEAGCASSVSPLFRPYFNALTASYSPPHLQETCLPQHKSCGWPALSSASQPLPLLVVAVGPEGSGHHTWSLLLDGVMDCLLTETNQYKYRLVKKAISTGNKKDRRGKEKSFLTEKVLNGFPHLTAEELGGHMRQQVPPSCRSSFDALDSFPYGLTESTGRQMNHPDLVNLHQLDGKLYRIKYLVLVRNTTECVMSALGRRFVKNIDSAVRTLETSLSYMEAALRGMLVAPFSLMRQTPLLALAPLAAFLELDTSRTKILQKRLSDMSVRSFSKVLPVLVYGVVLLLSNSSSMHFYFAQLLIPTKREYDFEYLGHCKGVQGKDCTQKVRQHVEDFLLRRAYMWPTFSAI